MSDTSHHKPSFTDLLSKAGLPNDLAVLLTLSAIFRSETVMPGEEFIWAGHITGLHFDPRLTDALVIQLSVDHPRTYGPVQLTYKHDQGLWEYTGPNQMMHLGNLTAFKTA